MNFEFSNTCLIDNWSLECSALLIENGIDANLHFEEVIDEYSYPDCISGYVEIYPIRDRNTRSIVFLGALANVLNSIILFDNLAFAKTGSESNWINITNFSHKITDVIKGYSLPSKGGQLIEAILRTHPHPGIFYYCYLAKVLNADILLNPLRSNLLLHEYTKESLSYGDFVFDVFNVMDKAIRERVTNICSDILKMGVIPNFELPAVANLVLSQANRKNEILDVAMDIRNSRNAKDLRKELNAILLDIKSSSKYSYILEGAHEAVISAMQKIKSPMMNQDNLNVGLSAFFVSVSQDLQLKAPRFMFFLRDVAKCRLELFGLKRHLKRLFDYSMPNSINLSNLKDLY